MRNAALHLYWNREKENRGEWKKDVMFSCCRNEKATEVILNLSASLKMSPYSSLSWHPSTRPALSSPCVHARFLPAPWVEGTSQSDSALLRPCPELTSHDKGGTHTVTWSLNNSPFVPSNWGCWSRYNAVPCALPCPAGLRQTHTDDRTSAYTASMTSGFTWHPPDSIHTGTQKKNTLRLYKELNSH